MRLTALGRPELRELEASLRAGTPCTLALRGRFPRRLRADQIIPLFDAVETDNPSLRSALRSHLPLEARPGGDRVRVTAVIPTNRGTPLGLGALRAQDCALDVLVLTNGGATAEGDRVFEVPWEGHGLTRQRGAEMAIGDYVLFTVDDALPRGAGCVRALVDALEEGGYDAVFGRQIPWPTSDPVTRARLERWTPPGRVHHPMERLDHVFALYRRETLLRHPLPPVPTGEDLRWRQGRRIGYEPQALVVHAHPREPRALYRRTRDLHRQHLAVGDPPAVPDLAALVGALPGALRPVLQGGLGELPNQLAELFGQWRAAKAGPAR
ncbi:MAG: hypothetical protein H6739_13750 [Alphaproteobacteria bacterium]|nr:hypothetical protein [Alphaproteobacteria bacterium]